MTKKPLEYILAANKKTIELYRISSKTLMDSSRFDFMVYRFSMWDEISKELEEWEDYISIDEATYILLHRNLCVKFRNYIENH